LLQKKAGMRIGLACRPEAVDTTFPVVELLFEKTVMKPADAEKLRGKASFIVHAPFYGTLCSKEQKVRDAQMRILEAARIGELLGADVVVVHAGFYSKQAPEDAYSLALESIGEILRKTRLRIGVETQPRGSQLGSLDEVLAMARENKRIIPVFNLGAIRQRNGRVDFERIFSSTETPLMHVDEATELDGAALPEGATLVASSRETAEALAKRFPS
jgi:deoxyribonuclease-4